MAENELGTELKRVIDREIAVGFTTDEEIVQFAIDYFRDEADEKVLRTDAVSYTAEAASRHRIEPQQWPAVTDCDRVDAAFADLETAGIVARQNFPLVSTNYLK